MHCGPCFHQQWNFSPDGSTSQIEDYAVDLDGVCIIQSMIDPNIAKGQALPPLLTAV